jgi:hypothetical protein
MPKSRPRERSAVPDGQIYQLKVTLNDAPVAIWRVVQVPGNVTLRQLHEILQLAMGWQNAHLHEFRIDGMGYGEPSAEFDLEVNDDRRFRLSSVAPGAGARFTYLYDFGDGWEHDVIVEKVISPESRLRYPLCVAGAGACPPEDVGGPWGYDEFLAAIRDPSHEQHDELLEWAGGPFDPERFDVRATNEGFDQHRFG